MNDTIISVKGLCKSYGTHHVLKNINFSFASSCIYGIVGPNGSGKTTLFKSILSFIRYSGEISISGYSVDNSSINISYVPEVIEIYPFLTGLEIFELYCEIVGEANREAVRQRFFNYADILGYKDENKLIKEHSKGNLRKLFLIISLAAQAEISLLDEPFEGLDPVTVEKTLPLLTNNKSYGRTIILNTHLFDVAKKVCDCIIFLKDGAIIQTIGRDNFVDIDILQIFGENKKIEN